MADPKSTNEPSIEEILASIREIISEDPFDAPKPAPSGAAEPAAVDEDEILDLNESVEDKVAEEEPSHVPPLDIPQEDTIDFTPETIELLHEPEAKEPDLHIDEEPVFEQPAPVFVAPAPAPAPMPAFDDSLLADTARNAAAAALARLSANVNVSRAGNGGLTLEDLVRDMLTPLLKDWLDANLPSLIERLVEREITRLTSAGR